MPKPLHIGLLGFGNIGCGVVEGLSKHAELLDQRGPRPLRLRRVADIDLDRSRHVRVDPQLLTTDSEAVVRDPDIDIIVELIGGIEPARTFVETALRGGKHVVTANKALLAAHGADLWALAAEHGVRLLFEAAVGGGIPVVRALCESLAGDHITRIQGILNGTCNYILTQMAEANMDYQEALDDAQELGYAEPDPTADVEGIDAANKIAILASLAFGQDIRYGDVYREGVTNLTPDDLHTAERNGYVIKHRAVAELTEDGRVAIGVRPSLLWADDPLSTVEGVLNGVLIDGDMVGSIFLAGPGAGPATTASAVLGDLMALSALHPDTPAPAPFLRVEPGRKIGVTSECACNGYWLRIVTSGARDAVAQTAHVLTERGVAIHRIEERPVTPGDLGETRAIEVFTARTSQKKIQEAAAALDGTEWSAVTGSVLVLPRID